VYPLRLPDGREVKYANQQLESFFGFLAARSPMVRGTLELAKALEREVDLQAGSFAADVRKANE
jgi:hypothetical protein